MKKLLLLLIISSAVLAAHAQQSETDSLKRLLSNTKESPERVKILENLSYAYLSISPDTSLQYGTEGLRLAEKINDKKGIAICLNVLGSVYFNIGDYPQALELYLRSLELREQLKDSRGIAITNFNIANVYTEQEDYPHALEYLLNAKAVDEKSKDSTGILFDLYSLSSIYLRMKKADSALYHADEAHKLARQLDDKDLIGAIFNTYGEIYALKEDYPRAINHYHLSDIYVQEIDDREVMASNYLGLAKAFNRLNTPDSALFYSRKAFALAQEASFMKQVLEASTFLTTLYKSSGNFDSAFKYQALSIATKDSLFNVEQVKKVQNLKLMEQQRQQSIEASKIKYRNKVKFFVVIFVSAVLLLIAFLLWRNNKQKQKAYTLLQQQKSKTDSALADLKATQMQLVQREKMASLGELMAGIAHEIQNPLNFVTNFTEVNSELLDELKEDAQTGNSKNVIELAEVIKANEQKINHHSKRADSIVKGMLEHTRISSGEKQLTDINSLAEEYLRLAYHGMRAKEKALEIKLTTEFDESIGQVKATPLDLGRVLLNLFNNAFYAVNEKKKQSIPGYQPEVSVVTKKSGGKMQIQIRDNGTGIPQKIADKIFQPFYTTKPPGEGTGLGLSLSYDIITKGHGGELQVETKEGEYTVFTIQLPLTDS